MNFSVHRQKIQCIFSDSKQILDQNNSGGSGDPKGKKPKILILSYPGRPSMDILVRSWQDLAKILEKF